MVKYLPISNPTSSGSYRLVCQYIRERAVKWVAVAQQNSQKHLKTRKYDSIPMRSKLVDIFIFIC
jgi:hypothetical protein